MPHDEPPHARKARFERIRRAKWLLRFLPRRARFHTYPVVGRFAAFARKRDYLWSFRYESLRSSLYMGPILALMPVLGVQLPIAFGLCLLLRTNFMVAGGLQFITNPITAAPAYYGTYKLGITLINISGFGRSLDGETSAESTIPFEEESPLHESETALVRDPATGRPGWTANIGTGINALILGGLLVGAVIGAILDLLWRTFILPAARHRAARRGVTAQVTPHDPSDTSPPFSS